MKMTARQPRRLFRPLIYAAATATIGGSVLYYSYRPRNIPGSDPAAVPPKFGPDGTIAPPRFPKARSRAEQIADLKRSAAISHTSEATDGPFSSLFRSGGKTYNEETEGDKPYDLLIIGGGATGSGIALDAATRGLRVACIERDDFSSGTSSKSTKLVHGGVRYLEKAVWELDYNQLVLLRAECRSTAAYSGQIQACQGGVA